MRWLVWRFSGGRRGLGCRLMPLIPLIPVVALLAFGVTPAAAHEIWPGVPGVVSMVLHPFLAPEMVLVMLGLGLLAGADERPATVWLSAAMGAVGVAIGIAAQVPLLAFPGLWWWPMIVASGIGLLVASGLRIGVMVTLVVAMLAAVTVGLGMPRERPHLSGAIEAWAGVTTALGIAMAVVAWPRAMGRHPVLRIAARVAGAWIGAIGCLGLAAAMR